MKLLKSWKKEMKIAFRGFYIWIELIVSIIVLMVLMMLIKPYPDGHRDEYVYYDMPDDYAEWIINREVKAGRVVLGEDKEVKLVPGELTLVNKDTGENEEFSWPEKDTVVARTASKIDARTGQKKGILYLMPDRESVIRSANRTGKVGAVIALDPKTGKSSYEYFDQGYETERYDNVLYILHTFDIEEVQAAKTGIEETSIGVKPRLNTREAFVPVYLTFLSGLMGMFIVSAYVFLDKQENVISALMVTPETIMNYLLSKIMMMVTVSVASATIIAVPVMGKGPSWLLLYMFLIITSFAFSALGLFLASFFDSMQNAFGTIYFVLIVLLLPIIPYYIGSFDPTWIHFLPTYHVLNAFKEILQGMPDIGYVMTTAAGTVAGGILFLLLSGKKFSSSLTD